MKVVGFILIYLFSFKLSARPVPPEEVIYGDDDRVLVTNETSDEWYQRARAVATRVHRQQLSEISAGLLLAGERHPFADQLCPEEPFSNYPVFGDCTAFLVGEAIMATAGHCVHNEVSCHDYVWVFDYRSDLQGELDFHKSGIVVSPEQVFECKKILERKVSREDGTDYAIFKLKTIPADRESLTINPKADLRVGDELGYLAYPYGAPLTLDRGAQVRSLDERPFFFANLDSFQGASGSPVFSLSSGEVEGILVRGEKDFEYDNDRFCLKLNRCPDDGCDGEEVMKISGIPYFQAQ